MRKTKRSNDGERSNLPAFDNRPCFFKIMHKGSKNLNLKIPPNFQLPEGMPPKAVLKGPSGACWNITVSTCDKDGSKIMEQGWHKFYQDHALGDNEFLVFRYNGDMYFDVQIFSKSGCEREQINIRTQQPPKLKEEEMEVEDEDEFQIREKGKRKSKEFENSVKQLRKFKGKQFCRGAADFTSKVPHFKQCLTRSNVDHPSLLRIPTDFGRKHFPEPHDRKRFTFYTNSQGKSWDLTLIPNGSQMVFSKGWRKFATDNNLKFRDCCVFELVALQQMRVHIFPTISM